MGYYMRFIVDDEKDVGLDRIAAALKEADAAYQLAAWDRERERAELCCGEDLYGEIEVNRKGTELMDEEIEELCADVEDVGGPGAERVIATLRRCKAMVVIRVLWQGREAVATLEKIDPLWEWLFANFAGLLQSDGEGYYDTSGVVLEYE